LGASHETLSFLFAALDNIGSEMTARLPVQDNTAKLSLWRKIPDTRTWNDHKRNPQACQSANSSQQNRNVL